MGVKKTTLYIFVLQLILTCFLVLLFLFIMLVIIGNAPVLILFTAPGIFLQIILITYFWLLLFSAPDPSPMLKKSNRI